MKTVHVIFNAHIDPVWLWPWQSGLDEILATCRSACDRLDTHSDLIFTRGEAWVYDEIERIDPALFSRIRDHIEGGRWEIVGGWWIQPDCNLPSGFAMEKQIELGKNYFESRFGLFPRIGYNVDSFGHAASLPGLMRKFGQDRYVMMRPQEEEMSMPSCLFRWRGYEDGPEVVTFRVVEAYGSWQDFDKVRIQKAVDLLPEGINDTMFFAGFGDHGGGPTERMIQWLRDHQYSLNGIKLVFSSPSRFFDAIWPQRESLPEVTGELQQHAIGCYSIYRPIKTSVRDAEHFQHQAEVFQESEAAACAPDAPFQLAESWKLICFNHFHDTLGGTCLPSAYPQLLSQLGHAKSVSDNLLQEGLRRKMNSLPGDRMQRIVLYNASEFSYDGPAEFTPWLDWQEWGKEWRLIDEDGAASPFQIIEPESLAGPMVRLIFPLKVGPLSMRVLRIQYTGTHALPDSPAVGAPEMLSVEHKITLSPSSLTFTSAATIEMPELMLYDDLSDTWSHGIDRYSDESIGKAIWGECELMDQGPVMASWIQTGVIGESRLRAEWRVYTQGFAELRLAVDWRESHKVLKLVQTLPGTPIRRLDGILGGWLTRPFDGRELPVRDGIIIETLNENGFATFGIAAPAVYAADATQERIRFTLLRSSIMAHHDPHLGNSKRRSFADQGEHSFVFRYFGGSSVTESLIDQHAFQLQRPLIMADLTRGMPHRLADVQ